MATAAIQAEYEAEAQELAAELEENGYLCSFGALAAPANDWEPAGDYTEIARAAVLPLDWNADFSSDVRSDDAMYLVSPIAYVPEIGNIPLGLWRVGIDSYGRQTGNLVLDTVDAQQFTHMIDADGSPREVISVQRFAPDGLTAIYYEIQVR